MHFSNAFSKNAFFENAFFKNAFFKNAFSKMHFSKMQFFSRRGVLTRSMAAWALGQIGAEVRAQFHRQVRKIHQDLDRI